MRNHRLLLLTSLLAIATVGAVAILGVAMGSRASDADREPSVLQPGDRDLCAVCGMFVARYPEWVAQVVYEDGSTAFFDGPKCMFEYLLRPEKHAGPRRGLPIARILVTAYYDREPLPAERALFVLGSDVAGPMGAELVPLATVDAAEEFMNDHHGERIVRFEEVTPELLAMLKEHSMMH
jgi:nitrous oxide reductase accessory protein NosL